MGICKAVKELLAPPNRSPFDQVGAFPRLLRLPAHGSTADPWWQFPLLEKAPSTRALTHRLHRTLLGKTWFLLLLTLLTSVGLFASQAVFPYQLA